MCSLGIICALSLDSLIINALSKTWNLGELPALKPVGVRGGRMVGKGGGDPWRAPGWWLVLLPAVAILPVMVFAILLTAQLSGGKEQQLEADLIAIADASVGLGDRILSDYLLKIEILSDLALFPEAFQSQADRLLSEGPWLTIRLHDKNGRAISSLMRPGLPDSARAILRGEPEAFESGTLPAVVAGDEAGFSFLLIRQEASNQSMSLTAIISLDPFSKALQTLDLPEGWIAALLGPGHRIAGRSRAVERYVGRRATPSLIDMIDSTPEDLFYSYNQEGEPVYTAIGRSSITGWSAAVGAPAGVARQIINQSRWWLAAGAASAAGVAALLAWLVMQKIRNEREAERRSLKAEGERQAEARLQDITAQFPGVLYRRVLHPDGTVTFPFISSSSDTPFSARLNDLMREKMTVEQVSQIFATSEARTRFTEEIRKSASTLDLFEFEGPIVGEDGTLSWIRSLARPHRRSDGSVVWDGALLDVSELKATAEALERRTSALQTVHAINLQLAAELDVQKVMQSVTDATTRLIGAGFGAFFRNPGPGEETYELFTLSGADRKAFANFPMPRHTQVFGPTLRGEGTMLSDDITSDVRYGQNDPHFGMPPGHLPVRSYLAVPVTSRSGEVVGGLFFGHPEQGIFDESAAQAVESIAAQTAVAMDNARMFQQAKVELDHRRRSEEHQRLLLSELNHRVKNTLAVVVSIADQTARVSRDREEFITAFRRRLIAIADGHTLLSEAEWKAAPLGLIISKALEKQLPGDDKHIQIHGPNVAVPPRQAIALSLVFHELSAGAKWRSQSAEASSIQVEWKPDPQEPQKLELKWTETKASSTEWIEDRFAGVLIDLNIRLECEGAIHRIAGPDGFECRITLNWDPQTSRLTTSADKNARTSFYRH